MPWSDGTGCHDLSFLNVELKLTFSLSSFIKRLFSSSLSAIRMVSSAYMSLLIYTQWIIYYLAIKMNKIMSFAATWMDLAINILSEISQTKIISQARYDITYVWNPKKKWYKWIIYKTETDSQTQKTNLWLPKRIVGHQDRGRLIRSLGSVYSKINQVIQH